MQGDRHAITVIDVALYFLPVTTRLPLHFGGESLSQTVCARVAITLEADGKSKSVGWGETPLNVTWAWKSGASQESRLNRLTAFCRRLVSAWRKQEVFADALSVGAAFIEQSLASLWEQQNSALPAADRMPWRAALLCDAPFDMALHDAWASLHRLPVYDSYSSSYMRADLSTLYGSQDSAFAGRFPADCFPRSVPRRLLAWHLVGAGDPLSDAAHAAGEEATAAANDGYPLSLAEWLEADGIRSVKIKLQGADQAWDHERIVSVGRICRERSVTQLSLDFNATVTDGAYVLELLDRIAVEHPELYRLILFVEQPFPVQLAGHDRDSIRKVKERKPIFADESAEDWKSVVEAYDLGYSGVALKTCKTQSGAVLALCQAKQRGMAVTVQDLTNPMLALIPHVALAARAGTVGGVEMNACQYYPEASLPEAAVHPGLYRRRKGHIDLSTLNGVGFGYQIGEIKRELPERAE